MPTINHPTLKAQEVALLEGDQTEPTWKSPNELIHERVNFDDTIWGFGLAGGAHYQTPLRVTYVSFEDSFRISYLSFEGHLNAYLGT